MARTERKVWCDRASPFSGLLHVPHIKKSNQYVINFSNLIKTNKTIDKHYIRPNISMPRPTLQPIIQECNPYKDIITKLPHDTNPTPPPPIAQIHDNTYFL